MLSHILIRSFDHFSSLWWSPIFWISNRRRRMVPFLWTNISALSFDIIHIIRFWIIWNIMKAFFSTTAYNIVVISCLRVKWFNLFLLAGVLLQYWNYPSNLNAFARQDNLILEALLEECSKLLFCLAASCDVEYGSFYELDPSGAFFVSSVGEQTVLGMLTAKMLTFIAVRLWQTT